jgi:hypothetical protein
LCFNAIYEILVCQSYLHCKEPQLLEHALAVYDPRVHFPSSLWMRKVRAS